MTRLLPPTNAGIAEAASLLRAGRLVAFGTETVYGLGARADDPDAVAAIYRAKSRPASNPLICHYASLQAATADIVATPLARQLAAAFWPGPLTLVLPRQTHTRLVAGASAGGPTAAIRVPDHPIALRLLSLVGGPVAAPSANLSGRVSPTTAAHVLDGLGGRIDAVLDCGPCRIGLESTVLDASGERPELLRPGGVSAASIAAVAGPFADPRTTGALRSPGQLSTHYAPSLPLRLNARFCRPDEALLAFGPAPPHEPLFQLSVAANLDEAAANLFAGLRALDAEGARRGLHGIAAMPIPHDAAGIAINDRLLRAAHQG